MILKEFRQMRRDRRTVALMIGLPILLLVVFGYAARFDVTSVDTAVVGADAAAFAASLPDFYDVTDVDPAANAADAHDQLRNAEVGAAFVTDDAAPTELLVDGTNLFAAQAAVGQAPDGVVPEILFNPELDTSTVMVPSLIGLILLFVGVVITSLGVVREREQGTLEQLAVMPLRPFEVTVGKIAPYFLVGMIDMLIVTLAGLWLFDVPFEGSILMFAAFAVVFLFVVLGLGVAISTVSKSQGEAIQLAIMVLLPQIMLSGMIFPLDSMAPGVRWIGYLLPLTWFIEGMRGVFLRGSDAVALLQPLGILVLMAVVVFGIAIARFRKDLAPKQQADDGVELVESEVALEVVR
ncbi:MAG TPA: ABC transporter permease [Ilumatobacteraceae bacterium]|nr:ABC transporter permease [Ilumatobacteraceae bacterium]